LQTRKSHKLIEHVELAEPLPFHQKIVLGACSGKLRDIIRGFEVIVVVID